MRDVREEGGVRRRMSAAAGLRGRVTQDERKKWGKGVKE
jgi:hypothetical protein